MRYLDICSDLPGNRAINLAGRRFGRLMVDCRVDGKNGAGERLWRCLCDCGATRDLSGSVLKRGRNRSCGCFRRERAGQLNLSHGQSKTLRYELLRGARRRAADLGLPFDITINDIVVPYFCPALGIEIDKGASRLSPGSPTLDRIIPARGYVVGNIAVISWRANKLKNNATADELARLSAWLTGVIQ